MLQMTEAEVIYTTFHVDVGETPFFVAVDYTKERIVVSIRGTLSMKDVLTDLNAEGEVLPLEPRRDDWVGHKGMVQAAVYIKNKLEDENLIQRAQQHNLERKTDTFGLVIVGHSLGAGTAAILSILLKPQHPSLLCYSYSPPGGKFNHNDTFTHPHTHTHTRIMFLFFSHFMILYFYYVICIMVVFMCFLLIQCLSVLLFLVLHTFSLQDY